MEIFKFSQSNLAFTQNCCINWVIAALKKIIKRFILPNDEFYVEKMIFEAKFAIQQLFFTVDICNFVVVALILYIN